MGDRALVNRERVTVKEFIDHGGPEPFDEILVEFVASGEVYLADGRLDPAKSLAVATHSPEGFWWGNVGRGPRSSRSPCCYGPPTAPPASPAAWRSPGRSSPACPRATSSSPWPPCTTGWPREEGVKSHAGRRTGSTWTR